MMQQQAEENGGHGGMDFVMLWRIVYCLRNGLPLDQNVYDAAAWSAVIDLSQKSVGRSAARLQTSPISRETCGRRRRRLIWRFKPRVRQQRFVKEERINSVSSHRPGQAKLSVFQPDQAFFGVLAFIAYQLLLHRAAAQRTNALFD